MHVWGSFSLDVNTLDSSVFFFFTPIWLWKSFSYWTFENSCSVAQALENLSLGNMRQSHLWRLETLVLKESSGHKKLKFIWKKNINKKIKEKKESSGAFQRTGKKDRWVFSFSCLILFSFVVPVRFTFTLMKEVREGFSGNSPKSCVGWTNVTLCLLYIRCWLAVCLSEANGYNSGSSSF